MSAVRNAMVMVLVAFGPSLLLADCSWPKDERPSVILEQVDDSNWKQVERESTDLQGDVVSVARVYGAGPIRRVTISSSIAGDIEEASLYCFQVDGRIDELRFEARTAWGWGYKKEISYHSGRTHSAEQYFDLRTRRPLKKGTEESWIAEHVQECLFVSKLPFYSLLKLRNSNH